GYRTPVAQRRTPRIDSLFYFASHTLDGPCCSEVIVELGKSSQNCFHELAFRVGIDRLRYRGDLHTVLGKSGFDGIVVSYVAGEAIDLPDNQRIYGSLFFLAKIDQRNQLRPISKLC